MTRHHSTADVKKALALAGWSIESDWKPVLYDLLRERDALYREVRKLRAAAEKEPVE